MSSQSSVFHRKLKGKLPLAQGGAGLWIQGADGRRWLDASGGAVVVNLGHGLEQVAQAVYRQIKEGCYFHPTMFTTPVVEELAAALAAHAPAGIDRFYFMSSGSEAVETALKLARQIHLARGQASRFKIISRWRSYHGLTLGALAVSGRAGFRSPFTVMLRDAVHIAPPYCLRCLFGLSYPACNLKCARALEEAILHQGPSTVSAFIAETVSGASLAAYPPPPGYWPLIREICDRHGVILIQDEVMCGMGRTGRWFASEHYEVIPDLVTLGKGLSGGCLPLSAMGVRDELYQEVAAAEGFAHGGTYSHHSVSAAAGLAAIRILEREGLVERAATQGKVLGAKLSAALADSPFVCDVRGIGMMWGVELAADKNSLAPFPRAEQVTERVWQSMFDRGVIVYKSPGLAGWDGDGLMVAPPFIISEEEMDLVVATLKEAIEETLS